MKVIQVNEEELLFDDNSKLYSNHEQDCCENHYLSFRDLTLKDFEGLEFDLNNDNFFSKIDGYGIALNPIKGFPVRVPGYGSNNGYYSTNLELVVEQEGKVKKTYDITECQEIDD